MQYLKKKYFLDDLELSLFDESKTSFFFWFSDVKEWEWGAREIKFDVILQYLCYT